MDRGTMRARVRLKINDSQSSSTDNFTDADLNALIYEAAQFVQGEIENLDQAYFEEVTTFTLAATDTVMALPAGCRRVVLVKRTDDNKNIPVVFIDKRDPSANFNSSSNYYLSRNRYYEAYLTKDSVVLTTPLQEASTMTMTYTKDIDDVANDAASYPFPVIAQQMAINKAVIMALGSENNKTEFWEKQYAECKEQLIVNLAHRQVASPQHVRFIPN